MIYGIHKRQTYLWSCSFCCQVPGRIQGSSDSCMIHECSGRCVYIWYLAQHCTHRHPHRTQHLSLVWNLRHSNTSEQKRRDKESREICCCCIKACWGSVGNNLFCADRAIWGADTLVVTLRSRQTGAVALRTSSTLIWTVSTVGEAITHQARVHTLTAATLIQVRRAFSLAACECMCIDSIGLYSD